MAERLSTEEVTGRSALSHHHGLKLKLKGVFCPDPSFYHI
jgi:hypothetical protein